MDHSEPSSRVLDGPAGARSAAAPPPSPSDPIQLEQPDVFMRQLLLTMVEFRDGNFSVRMPADLTGLSGQDRRHLQRHRGHERRRAQETSRVSRVVGKEGKLKQRMNVSGAAGGLGRRSGRDQHADRRPGLADDRSDARGRRGGQGRSGPVDGLEVDGRPLEGRVPAVRQAGQHDDRPAVGVHVRSDARGARGRHRRQARRPGAGQGRVRRLEGPDRVGQPDGRQPDGPGPQHRRRDDRRGQRRPVQEDHRRRPRRDPAAQGSHQHDGRPAARRSPRK